DRISAQTCALPILKPWGKYTAVDMDKAGGILVVLKRLLDAKLLEAQAITVTGRTIGEEAAAAQETKGQTVVKPLREPIAPTGGMVILKGSLAPEGCVLKVAGHRMSAERFTARVFDREEDAEAAVGGPIAAVRDGDSILIDPQKRLLELEIKPEALRARLATVEGPKSVYKTGALAKYARLVSSASQGAVTSL